MEKPSFSVITVNYNGSKEMCTTLESVLNQTLAPHEYIIVDGDSTDSSLYIIESYRSAFETKGVKFIVVSEPDNGIYDAMNKGLALATGDFISFINVGDWYEKDAIQSVSDFYSKKPFDLTYGGLHYIKQNGKIINKMSRKDLFVTSRHWNHPSMFLRRPFYEKYHFDCNYKIYSDFDLYLKLRKDKECKIQVMHKIIANFKAGGVSNDFGHLKERQIEKYSAYRKNGYSRMYWFEAFFFEIIKSLILRPKEKGN